MRKKFIIDKSFFEKINMSDKVIFLHYNKKKGKINGLKHKAVIIDELKEIKLNKVMKNDK